MSRQLVAVAAVALLVAFAGCSQFAPGGSATAEPTETRTDAPPPGTESPSATAGASEASATETETPVERPAENRTAGGAPSPTRTRTSATPLAGTPRQGTPAADRRGGLPGDVLSTHRAVVRAADYELSRYEYRHQRVGNRSYRLNRTATVRSSVRAERAVGGLVETRPDSNASERRVFVTADRRYAKAVTRTGVVTYDAQNASAPFESSHEETATTALGDVVADAVFGNGTTVDGRSQTVTRYEVESLAVDLDGSEATVRDLSGYLLRGGGGLVREAELRYAIDRPGVDQSETVERYYEIEVGDRIAVDRPSWVAAAENGTG